MQMLHYVNTIKEHAFVKGKKTMEMLNASSNVLYISFTLYSNIVRVVGAIIAYSVGFMNCRFVFSKFLTLPF